MSSIANSVKNKARLFFAIELPQAVKDQLELLQQTHSPFSGRAVKPHNFHITLQFLGAVDRSTIHDLADSIESPQIKPFNLNIERFAYYPKTEIGCVEINQGQQQLKSLKKYINSSLSQAGFHFAKDKHEFRPHVTLSRECQPLGDIQKILDISFKAESFCLMESIQNEKGVYYEVLEEWPIYEPSIKEQFFGIRDS
jgi:2'-5' RNA ligase